MGIYYFINLSQKESLEFPYGKFLSIIVGLLLRWLTSLHSYSGENKPPLYGDYEAQRHWMEVTLNLPVKEWYFNTTDNDLLYWGLDYPPLTAYHSLLCGHIAKFFVPESVELFTSRGYESYEHKFFMRVCVLVSDLLIYIPALVTFFSFNVNYSEKHKNNVMLVSSTFVQLIALIYPGLILIDYGHYQFNCISLGCFIWSVVCLSLNYHILTCILFCLSLNYKQMELYHALPFFFYYLGMIYRGKNIKLLLKLSLSVLANFIIVWLPFLELSQIQQIVHRIFPIYRGLFEDKVANFWCTANVFYKFKTRFSNEQMAFLCLCTTILSILPSCFALFLKPTYTKFQLCLINVSLGFFLFSYHVHEKSILLVAIPVFLYLPKDPFPCIWFLLISSFSMFDLYIKDNLVLPSIVLMYVFYLIVHDFLFQYCKLRPYLLYLFLSSLFGSVLLMCLSLFVEPPHRYLHLFSLFISSYSFGHFILFFIYFYVQQLELISKYLKTKIF